MKNKAIAPVMRKMEIGDYEIYPASRKTAIESTRQRLQGQFLAENKKFSVVKSKGSMIRVTRIS